MISVVIFTLNEEIHLPSCLDALDWADDVLVVDSFSVDRTEQICRERGIRFVQHAFTGFGDQRNWALEHGGLKHEWALILDADERVTPELVAELRARLPSIADPVAAFRVARRFYWWGKWLRHSSLYPTYVVRLVRRGRVRYVNRGHAETQEVQGEVRTLDGDLLDENRKGLAEWLARQNRYSGQDAEYELAQEGISWSIADLVSGDPLIRRAALKRLATAVPGRPVWYFFYSYVLCGGFLDGAPGFVFCVMRSMYQGMVAMKKHELRLLRNGR